MKNEDRRFIISFHDRSVPDKHGFPTKVSKEPMSFKEIDEFVEKKLDTVNPFTFERVEVDEKGNTMECQPIHDRLSYMKCRHCKELMFRGSGYFSTDYQCPKCGREYNGSGTELASRHLWGEETGESFC